MSRKVQNKLNALHDCLRDMRSVLIAYSGGVDSALLLAVAHRALGGRALGCIGVSPSYPKRELRAAIALADELRARYRIVSPLEHLDARYAGNAENRCFFCKTALFDKLQQIAEAESWNCIADGVHLDDVQDHTYGIRAAHSRNVRSPLLELDLRKCDVREMAQALRLSVWDKPAMACLASRVPHGTPITPQLLQQIERAEDVLADAGFREFRVRHHGDLARIELAPAEFQRALLFRRDIIEGIHQSGYRYVTLDLAGFRESANPPMVRLRVCQHEHVEAPVELTASGRRIEM